MTTVQTMKERLSKVGVYNTEAPVIGWELTAYAVELERLYDRLRELFRERFITTAENEGLAVYERLFGPERSGESVQERREKLLLRLNLNDGDFTPAGIHRALESFGLSSYRIDEFPSIGKLNVTAETDYDAAAQAWISREVAKIIPAHIEFQITFNTLTWAQWDSLNRSFAAIDAEDQTWAQIDSREPE